MTLGSIMVHLALSIDEKKARIMLEENLKNGKGYEKFVEFISFQGGDLEKLQKSSKVISIKSNQTGYINRIYTLELGELVRKIGAGRYQKEDNIDYQVGIVLDKKVGDFVLKDEELLKIYVHEKNIEISKILDCFEVGEHYIEPQPLIYEIIQ